MELCKYTFINNNNNTSVSVFIPIRLLQNFLHYFLIQFLYGSNVYDCECKKAEMLVLL